MKTLYMIVNPHGGLKKGLKILDLVKPVFEQADVKLLLKETEYAGHAYDFANKLDFNNIHGICAIGGDGTLYEIINGMLKRNDNKTIPIGLVTGGTGNSFMHDLDCLNPVNAAKRIIKFKRRAIDIAEVENTLSKKIIYSFNIVGWGVATDTNKRAEKMRWLGEMRYNVAAVIEVLKGSKRIAKFSFDDEKPYEDDFVFILACNTIHTGKGMKAAPRAKLDDGLIDLVIVKKANRFKLLKLFPKLFTGDHLNSPLVSYKQVKKFSIMPKVNSDLNIDGELVGETPINVSVKKGLIDVLV
jgi:YegS/Rv2252/BmrU family lipid kinase